MFSCSKCVLLQEEIKFLRETNQKLTDRLIAMANPQAYAAVQFNPQGFDPSEFYGGEHDEMVGHNELGQKIIYKKKEPETQ